MLFDGGIPSSNNENEGIISHHTVVFSYWLLATDLVLKKFVVTHG